MKKKTKRKIRKKKSKRLTKTSKSPIKRSRKRRMRKTKLSKKRYKIKGKKSRKVKKRSLKRRKKKIRKIKRRASKIKRKKTKLSNFGQQINRFKQLSFKKVISFVFKPLIKSFGDYRHKKKIEKLKAIEKERKTKEKQIKLEEQLRRKLKEQELRHELRQEKRIEQERKKDIKNFLRKEQAEIRKEQAERQRKFLFELKLEKQIENFKKREIKELQNLEQTALKAERSEYSELQVRIEKLKDKYRAIRDQKIRERVEALGVEVQPGADREALLERERQYVIERHKIENTLESFYRSAASLCFQLNKRYIPKHKSLLRCIDHRYETGEIYIRWDDAPEEDWLLLIYIKNNSPDEGIVVEDKTNPEKNTMHEFKSGEIFRCSDLMVDVLVQLLEKERQQKAS